MKNLRAIFFGTLSYGYNNIIYCYNITHGYIPPWEMYVKPPTKYNVGYMVVNMIKGQGSRDLGPQPFNHPFETLYIYIYSFSYEKQ
jgi:hypothetical protein